MNIVAIIQARTNSTRLPGKVLKKIEGVTLIEWLVLRASYSKLINSIVVATTKTPEDTKLFNFLNERNIPVFRGSEEDVLTRFYEAAISKNADIVVRLTADDPFKDPEVIDLCIKEIADNPDIDYCSNTIHPTFPEGIDVEAFKFSALESANHNASLRSEREHVTPYIWKNPHIYKIHNIKSDKDSSEIRLTVDYPNDLKFLREIAKAFSPRKNFSYKEILKLLAKKPDIKQLSPHIMRNEGYSLSVDKERRQKYAKSN